MYFFCLAWPGLHLIRGLQPWEGKARLCSCSTRCQYDRCRTDMQLTQICVGWNSPISRPLCETHFMIHLQLKCQNRQRNWKNSEITQVWVWVSMWTPAEGGFGDVCACITQSRLSAWDSWLARMGGRGRKSSAIIPGFHHYYDDYASLSPLLRWI